MIHLVWLQRRNLARASGYLSVGPLIAAALVAGFLVLNPGYAVAQTPAPSGAPVANMVIPVAKILQQGVPKEALEKLLQFREANMGRSFHQDTYTCDGLPASSLKYCGEEERTRSTQDVTLINHEYAMIADFRLNSIAERLYVIHLPSGQVDKMRVTHGKKSGSLYAYKFSNIKDSNQTSLGIYIVGGTYEGSHGTTLRLYGLQGSNDQAYNRDIVMHAAAYASKIFLEQIDYRTGKPYTRLGLSFGCPAIAPSNATKFFPLLKGGALLYHYHPELEEAAQSGQEIIGINLEAQSEK